MSVGAYEIIIILVVLLVVFNQDELPDVIRSLIRTVKSVQRSAEKTKEELEHIIIDREDLEG